MVLMCIALLLLMCTAVHLLYVYQLLGTLPLCYVCVCHTNYTSAAVLLLLQLRTCYRRTRDYQVPYIILLVYITVALTKYVEALTCFLDSAVICSGTSIRSCSLFCTPSVCPPSDSSGTHRHMISIVCVAVLCEAYTIKSIIL